MGDLVPSPAPPPKPVETFATVERNIAKVDGLVVPLSRKEKRRGGFEIYYPSQNEFNNDGMNFTFRVFQQLGAWDESVLLVVLKVMGQHGKFLYPEPEGPNARAIRHGLDAGGAALAAATLLVDNTSYAQLLRHMGLDTQGRPRSMMRESLKRLTATTLWVRHRDGSEGSMNLLTTRISPDGRLHISIHYLLARAFLGDSRWARIDLDERWALSGDIPKILHRWLSAWLDEGEERQARLSTLERHVWGDSSTGNDRSRRFQDLRKALAEIADLGTGWTALAAEKRGDAAYTIRRPDRPAGRVQGVVAVATPGAQPKIGGVSQRMASAGAMAPAS